MTVLNHALLGASVVALAAAGLRLASPLAERGLARVIAAATFATAAAVAEAILLGLASLGGSTAALTVAALATGAAALAWLPRPAGPLGGELGAAWRARTPPQPAGPGGVRGAAPGGPAGRRAGRGVARANAARAGRPGCDRRRGARVGGLAAALSGARVRHAALPPAGDGHLRAGRPAGLRPRRAAGPPRGQLP